MNAKIININAYKPRNIGLILHASLGLIITGTHIRAIHYPSMTDWRDGAHTRCRVELARYACCARRITTDGGSVHCTEEVPAPSSIFPPRPLDGPSTSPRLFLKIAVNVADLASAPALLLLCRYACYIWHGLSKRGRRTFAQGATGVWEYFTKYAIEKSKPIF